MRVLEFYWYPTVSIRIRTRNTVTCMYLYISREREGWERDGAAHPPHISSQYGPSFIRNADDFTCLHFNRQDGGKGGAYERNNGEKMEVNCSRLTAKKKGHPWVYLWWIVGVEVQSIHRMTSWRQRYLLCCLKEMTMPLSFAANDTSTTTASWLLTPRFFRSPPADLEYPFDPVVTLFIRGEKKRQKITQNKRHGTTDWIKSQIPCFLKRRWINNARPPPTKKTWRTDKNESTK